MGLEGAVVLVHSALDVEHFQEAVVVPPGEAVDIALTHQVNNNFTRGGVSI